MDDRHGRFVTGQTEAEFFEKLKSIPDAVERLKAKDGVFQVGEWLTIKGSLFKVEEITEDGLKLRLLPLAK